jgi:hypothetical protein
MLLSRPRHPPALGAPLQSAATAGRPRAAAACATEPSRAEPSPPPPFPALRPSPCLASTPITYASFPSPPEAPQPSRKPSAALSPLCSHLPWLSRAWPCHRRLRQAESLPPLPSPTRVVPPVLLPRPHRAPQRRFRLPPLLWPPAAAAGQLRAASGEAVATPRCALAPLRSSARPPPSPSPIPPGVGRRAASPLLLCF